MFKLIKQLADTKRLLDELERAQAEIASLRQHTQPKFREVAKDFDANGLQNAVFTKVEAELRPIIELEFIHALQQMASQCRTRGSMKGAVAFDINAQTHVVEFYIPELRFRIAYFGG